MRQGRLPMHEWLTRVGERGHTVETPGEDGKTGRFGIIIDQRRAPEEARALYALDGADGIIPLFAGTALDALAAHGPWVGWLGVDSPALKQAESICRKRGLGWMWLPPGDATEPCLELLQRLSVLDDAGGGQSLVQLQRPEAWSALLAVAPSMQFDHWLHVLGAVYTPTPTGGWRCWTGNEPREAERAAVLDGEQCQALDDAPLAWWLGRELGIALEDVPPQRLEQLRRLREAGIHQPREWRRRLPDFDFAASKEA
ncbi:DUF4123 domain-containing protein [Thioalkalivibrio sp. ALR17-21]|uniref:DUF4123 domain-containing protein n=1 Tax=Thioalkalivibrio sp. ALR17-21 TaxID=1269813 RepID=UPI00041C9219|nr:DUF4123 domain-containing protein [Thioalkalivibrio sp. ALR17-21]